MIITFTGLGGSGKTTLINLLKKEKKFKYFHYPEFLILLSFVQNISKRNNKGVKKNTPFFFKKNFFIHFKVLFYLIDCWFTYLIKILPFHLKKELIILDRAFFDLFISYIVHFGYSKKIAFLLTKLLPPQNLLIYLDITPEISLKRKYEWPLEFLQKEKKIREEIIKKTKGNVYTFDARQSPEKLLSALREIIEINEKIKINSDTFLLLVFLDKEIALIFPSAFLVLKPFFKDDKIIKQNRINFALKKKMGEKLFLETEHLGKLQKGLGWLEEISKKYLPRMMIIKDFTLFEIPHLPNDIDVSIPVSEFGRMKSIFKNLKMTEPLKFEFQKENFPKFDFYLGGIHDSGLLFIDEKELWENCSQKGGLFFPSLEIQILLIIEHSINETSLVTLFDFLQVKNLFLSKKIDEKILLKVAQKHGWINLLNLWIGYLNGVYFKFKKQKIAKKFPCLEMQKITFPIHLPLGKTFLMWVYKSILEEKKKVNLMKNIIFFAIKALRMYRARLLKKVPFHE